MLMSYSICTSLQGSHWEKISPPPPPAYALRSCPSREHRHRSRNLYPCHSCKPTEYLQLISAVSRPQRGKSRQKHHSSSTQLDARICCSSYFGHRHLNVVAKGPTISAFNNAVESSCHTCRGPPLQCLVPSYPAALGTATI